ncbi:MAG: triple tyrosine motif-containing protein, partial [Parafilimonas sp.]
NIPVITSVSSLQSETHEYITALCDKQSNWWLATSSEGLQKISPTKQYFNSKILINDSTNKQSQYDVVSCNRYDNILWVGTYGDGFFEIDISSSEQQQHRFYNTGEDIWANFIWNIRRVNSDTLWIGTQFGMFWYSISSKKYGRIPPYPDKPSLFDSVPITTQFEDSRGLVWMGLGKGNGVCSFDSKEQRFTYYRGNTLQGYPLRYPLTILEDKKGNLWFTNDASSTLVYWNRKTAQFKTFATPSSINKQSGFSGLWGHDDAVLWLGSITGGLIKFRPSTNEAIIYGHDKGLANGHISSIYEDSKKKLWLATDAGLSCFDEHTETFINYSAKDGLPVSYTASFFYYDELTKRLYTGGKGTLFYLEPDEMNLNQPPQKPIIISMRVNGEPCMFNKNEPAKFSPRQNDITIKYTAVDLTHGTQNKYAYKLIGEDTNWILAGNQRQINFSHLASGSYTFIVKAGNTSGSWNTQTASVSFIIRAPFTQTVWFYILILAAIAGIFYTMYRFRLKQLMRTELVRSEISKNLHDEVGSHLTNISLSSLLAQKQLHNENAISRLLDRIYQDSQKVSESMREIVWSINPKIDTLGEALPRMLHYASELLEAKNIELQAEISTDVEHVKLNMQKRRDVYLIFKEAVNNMAKHSKATQAAIHFNLVNTSFVMLITDNGTGFDVTAPLTNNGLKNMQERAQSHHWKLQLDSNLNAGTTITLKVQIA